MGLRLTGRRHFCYDLFVAVLPFRQNHPKASI
jgi:hypothetical protein